MPQVIVVGGGICGLQLAALLASDGVETLVLEKLGHVGGRAFLWEKDGFTVDNGIHLIRFGPKSATARVFSHLNHRLEFVDLGKSYVALRDGRVADFPTGPGGFLSSGLLSGGERFKALRVLLKLRKRDPSEFLEVSVQEWLEQNGISGGLRDYFHLVSASMQVCPFLERASAGEMLLNVKSVLEKRRSVMYPAGGWRYIYETLRAVIGSRGEVRTGAEVKRVLVEGGRAEGVELAGGERISAEQVVINLPVQQITSVVEPSLLPPLFAAQCQNLRPTAGVVLDYGLNRRVSEDRGLWYLQEPMSFGLFTSNLCPHVAPPGKQLLTWFQPTEVEDMADPQRARNLERALEQAIFRTFPALEKAIGWRRAMHLKMVDGVEVNVSQHRGKRPGYRVPGIENLFLVGDSLKAPGAGGDIGHESVLECYAEMTGKRPG